MTQEPQHEPSTDTAQALTFDQVFAIARQLHRDDRLEEAELLYRRLLAAVPDQPDVLNLLAIVRVMRDDSSDARRLLQRATEVAPGFAGAYNNLGNVLKQDGQLEEAATAYRRAIELDSELADAHNNLGIIYTRTERLEDAVAAYREAIRCNPHLVDAYFNLGSLLEDLRRFEEAAAAFRHVISHQPNNIFAYQGLGRVLYRLDRTQESADVYREWLKRSPDSTVALHMLASCTGENVPDRASDNYIRAVFDRMADTFDSHLMGRLKYRAPQLVVSMLEDRFGSGSGALDMLDAGCGTGLCGPLLKPYAHSLAGVDLSSKMLQLARQRGVYDALTEAELSAFLEQHKAAYDVIASADTIIYFGRLEAISRAAAAALRPGGLFVFTVERFEPGAASSAGIKLTSSGRYAHSESYLREVLTAAGFAVERVVAADLRMEAGRPVVGLVVTARAGQFADMASGG